MFLHQTLFEVWGVNPNKAAVSIYEAKPSFLITIEQFLHFCLLCNLEKIDGRGGSYLLDFTKFFEIQKKMLPNITLPKSRNLRFAKIRSSEVFFRL